MSNKSGRNSCHKHYSLSCCCDVYGPTDMMTDKKIKTLKCSQAPSELHRTNEIIRHYWLFHYFHYCNHAHGQCQLGQADQRRGRRGQADQRRGRRGGEDAWVEHWGGRGYKTVHSSGTNWSRFSPPTLNSVAPAGAGSDGAQSEPEKPNQVRNKGSNKTHASIFLNNGLALLAGDGRLYIVSEYAGPAEKAVLVS